MKAIIKELENNYVSKVGDLYRHNEYGIVMIVRNKDDYYYTIQLDPNNGYFCQLYQEYNRTLNELVSYLKSEGYTLFHGEIILKQ